MIARLPSVALRLVQLVLLALVAAVFVVVAVATGTHLAVGTALSPEVTQQIGTMGVWALCVAVLSVALVAAAERELMARVRDDALVGWLDSRADHPAMVNGDPVWLPDSSHPGWDDLARDVWHGAR